MAAKAAGWEDEVGAGFISCQGPGGGGCMNDDRSFARQWEEGEEGRCSTHCWGREEDIGEDVSSIQEGGDRRTLCISVCLTLGLTGKPAALSRLSKSHLCISCCWCPSVGPHTRLA